MESRSAQTVSRWKKRVADLITPESANVLVACIPELRSVFAVGYDADATGAVLNSVQSTMRLKVILGSMFQTFALKNKVFSLQTIVKGSLAS